MPHVRSYPLRSSYNIDGLGSSSSAFFINWLSDFEAWWSSDGAKVNRVMMSACVRRGADRDVAQPCRPASRPTAPRIDHSNANRGRIIAVSVDALESRISEFVLNMTSLVCALCLPAGHSGLGHCSWCSRTGILARSAVRGNGEPGRRSIEEGVRLAGEHLGAGAGAEEFQRIGLSAPKLDEKVACGS